MSTISVWQANLRREEANCKNGVRHLVFRGRFQRNNSWTKAQQMAMLDTILTGFQCAPIYIIQSKKTDDVFDGAHRLETACDFVSNKIRIQKVNCDSINWATSPLADYEGMYFSDLEDEVKVAFTDYMFTVTKIPTDYAEDPERLATLWVRLNNSGNILNKYEKYIPIYDLFYTFIRENRDVWFGTHVYSKAEARRGELDVLLMRMLALSEESFPTKFSSQPDIEKKWRFRKFGAVSEVEARFLETKSEMQTRLKHLFAVYKCFEKHLDPDTTNDIILKYIISRIAYRCDTRPKLHRCESRFVEYTKMMLQMPREDIIRLYGCHDGGPQWQQKLLVGIDRDIHDIVQSIDDPRLFTPTQKAQKLKEQGGLCTWCNHPIVYGEKSVCHHKMPWSRGGPTTLDNLQVLHAQCHTDLHLNSDA